MRIRFGEDELVIDPYLSDAVAAQASEPHLWQRACPAPIAAAGIRSAVAVLGTHEHGDHIDRETVVSVLDASPSAIVVLPHEARGQLEGVVHADRLRTSRGEGDVHDLGPFRVIAVPAAHSRTYTVEHGHNGHRWQGFLVEVAGRRIYHAGDTVVFDGLLEAVLSRGPIDLAMLPINGRDPYRERHDVVGNLWPREAVDLAAELRTPVMVPMHHDLFAFNGIAVGQAADYAVQRRAPLEIRCLTAGTWTELSAVDRGRTCR